MKGSQGTALVEFSLSAVMVTLFILMIVLLGYFIFAKVRVSNIGYDALICVAERQPQSLCRKKAMKRLKRELPFGRIDRVHLKESRGWFRANINWTLFQDIKVHYTKSLRY